MTAPARARLALALRIAVSAACIVLTVRLVDWAAFDAVLAGANRTLALAVVPGLLGTVFALAWRWHTLLAANGFDMTYARVLRMTWVGLFFSNFLPGSVGGDVARMMMAAGGADRKAGAAATVFLDRLMGLAAMSCLAAVAVVPLAGDARLRVPVALALGLLGALVVGYFVYFSRGLRGTAAARWVKDRLPAAARDVDGVLASVRRSPRLLALSLGQSLCAQFSIIFVAYGLSKALGMRVGVLPFLLFEVLIFVVTALPVSIGGWGVQEAAYAGLFATVGVPAAQAVALSILLKLALIVISVPGGLLFARGGRTSEAAPVSTRGQVDRS